MDWCSDIPLTQDSILELLFSQISKLCHSHPPLLSWSTVVLSDLLQIANKYVKPVTVVLKNPFLKLSIYVLGSFLFWCGIMFSKIRFKFQENIQITLGRYL